jgi:hypothetical protein
LNLLPADDHVWRGGAALLLALADWAGGDLEVAAQTHAEGIASLEKAGAIALAISAACWSGTTFMSTRKAAVAAAASLESVGVAIRGESR